MSAFLLSAGVFIYIKLDQRFRIVRRSYFDEIERKVLIADGLIAQLQRQIQMQHDGQITKEIVAPLTSQLTFNLPTTNSRTFHFPYKLTDPETGECIEWEMVGKWSDWRAWQSGKVYVSRRGKEQWIDPDELTLRDLIPVLRKQWNRKTRKWDTWDAIWIYPDQRLDTDLDTGPFENVEA